MKTRLLVAVAVIGLVLVVGQAVARLLEFNPGEVLHAIDLNAIVKALTGATADSTPIQVNCPGDSLANVLPQALPGSTILLTGTCNETILITTDRLTFDGQSSPVLDGGDGTQPVIDIVGARGVTIRNLTVRRGFHGIRARQNAAVTLEGVIAQDNADSGIRIDENSTAQLTNCTALQNGGDGILAFRNSSLTFSGTIVSDGNGVGDVPQGSTDGISIVSNSNAFFTSGTLVTTNRNVDRGLAVVQSSNAFFFFGTTATANNNGDAGISVTNSSSLRVLGGLSTITANENGNRGLAVLNTSTLNVTNGTINAARNTSDGISVMHSSTFDINNESTILTELSSDDGVIIIDSSSIATDSSSTLTTRTNAGDGIQVSRASASLSGATTAIDNTSNGVSINESGVFLGGTTLVQNNDVGVNVNRGNLVAEGTLNILLNHNMGLSVNDGSMARLRDGSMAIDGNTNDGILVIRNSQVRLASNVGTFSIQIRSNMRHGISVSQQSNARLESGTAISGNADDGLHVRDNSSIVVTNTSVTGNSGDGMEVDDGSANVSNSTITSHGIDVRATFGSRLTLNNNTIDRIVCPDGTVLFRGLSVCLSH